MFSSLNSCTRCTRIWRASRPLSSKFNNLRCIHSSVAQHANPLPVTGTGPAPDAPRPSVSQATERLARQRAQAELLKQAKEIRAAQQPAGTASKGGALRKRFWKEVFVKTQDDGSHTIHLDHRPVRTPLTKSVLPIPPSKPHLATAIALEWDNLTSAQQALKTHLIPLTSMASRAVDLEIQDEEMRKKGGTELSQSREEVVRLLMRYLQTDTLLCWVPEKGPYDALNDDAPGRADVEATGKETLRQKQIRVAQEIISYLTSVIWPGVTIKPVLDDNSILPSPQPQETQDVIRGWLSGLPAWELAGLERAVLATKSLCVGTRLMVDWSEGFQNVHESPTRPKFGIEEAAQACNLEVNWQTAMWGEVEDTHDVNNEDLRRQLGSVVLLVSGTS